MPKLIYVLLFTLAATASTSAQTAVVSNTTAQARVNVNLEKLKPQPTGTSSGGLFLVQDNGQLRRVAATLIPDADDAHFHFEFPVPAGSTPDKSYHSDKSYQVVLFTPIKDESGADSTVALTIPVTTRLQFSVERDVIRCRNGMSVVARTQLRDFDWAAVDTWLRGFKDSPKKLVTIQLREHGTSKWKDYTLKSFSPGTPPQTSGGGIAPLNSLRLCLKTEEALPVQTFDATFEFHGDDRPADYGPKVEGKEIEGRYVTSFKGSELKDPSDRTLEQNIDIGGSFTTSVADVETPATATTPATTQRERTNRGVLDVRFAPTLNLFNQVIESNKWLTFVTPFFINANIATGKIEEDTLSLNRVLLGIEGESRYNVRHGSEYPLTHRFVYGLTHASDRDFKQKEFTGKLEYRPIFWKLNNPINLNYTVLNNERVPGNFGFTFLPTVGFEIGRTYQRRNPAPDIKPSDTVRRLYFDIDMRLDLTRRLTFSVKDTFYIRGETPEHRLRNYFKGGFEAPLGPVFTSAVHSLFLSFERGDLAPFATPNVNVFKAGYRIQANYCRRCR
jgi:hypothetical protein